MDNRVDKLVLLLTADWFVSSWHYIGFNVDMQVQVALARACRGFAFGDAEPGDQYYDISFSERRLSETRRKLVDAIDCHVMDIRAKGRLLEKIAEPLDSDLAAFRIANAIVSNRLSEIATSDRIRGLLARMTVPRRTRPEFVALSLASTSPWDLKVRAFLGGDFDVVIDYLVAAMDESFLRESWLSIMAEATASELKYIVHLYQEAAADRDITKVIFPAEIPR